MTLLRLLSLGTCVALTLLCFAGCGRSKTAPHLIGPLSSNTLIAVVNGSNLYAGPIENIIERTAAQYREATGQEPSEEQLSQQRRQLIDQLIMETIVRQRLANADVAVSPAEFQNEYVDVVTNQFGSWKEYYETLARHEISTAQFARAVMDQLKLIKLVRKEMAVTPATDEDARTYYAAHSNEFDFPASVALAHILLRAHPGDSAARVSNTIARLQGIRSEILQGLPFATAARKYSECPSRTRGGSLGTIYAGDDTVADYISTTAFALAVSNISDVVTSEHGCHLFYVTARRPAYTAAYEEIHAELRQVLTEEKERRALQQWLRKVRAEALVDKKFK
ncbi:MAG: peptidylprolyl isomerase [bacterium]|nr:peptidylprolyl isomerase [bacterium]